MHFILLISSYTPWKYDFLVFRGYRKRPVIWNEFISQEASIYIWGLYIENLLILWEIEESLNCKEIFFEVEVFVYSTVNIVKYDLYFNDAVKVNSHFSKTVVEKFTYFHCIVWLYNYVAEATIFYFI